MPVEYAISSLHIVESLGESFGEPGRELMRRLQTKSRTLSSFPIVYHKAFERTELFDALNKILTTEAQKGSIPILHIEAHGNVAGIELRDGTTVLWTELAQKFRPLNIATGFNLLVVLACCDGIHQIQAFTIHEVSPFCAVVGCEGTIYTPELLNGYERFYEILVNDGKALRAEAELQAAVTRSAGTRFRLLSAEYAFASGYADYFRKTHDLKNQAERIARYRQVLEHIREQNGDPTPTTDTEILTYLQHAEKE
jgi:hypothetical protein